MAGIIHGRVKASSKGREPIRFTEVPTPVKYLLLEVPSDNTDPTSGGGAATGRIPISIGGATRYIPYYT